MEEKDISIENPEIDKEDVSSDEVITQPFSPNDIKLSNPPMNLGDLIDMITYGWVNFNTEYQRADNLWSDKKQSRLIESALLGLRLPAFYFEEVNKRKWNIIDGLQRCSAIRNFCIDETLILSDLEFLNFNGKKYNEFAFDLKRDIRMLPITVNVLSAGVPDEVKYILFKRLNTGGIELTPQEIRNAMFQGTAIDTVKKISKEPLFIKATEGKIPTNRKQDQDFVSRFIAFYMLGYESYTPDLDDFINKCMHNINKMSSNKEIEQMIIDFQKAMSLSISIFGNDAFRKRENLNDNRKPLNKAYFEVIAVSFARLKDQEIEFLLNNKELLKKNLTKAMCEYKSYNNSFSGGTGKRESVKKRFSVFSELLNKSMNGIEISIIDDNTIEDRKL